MSELSQRLMVTGGNVTGITDGLEKEGLVVREVDRADRRVFRVKLTAEGQRQFRAHGRRARAVGHRALRAAEHPKHKKQLAELLGELKSHISQRAGAT